jgi:hypothetical protein
MATNGIVHAPACRSFSEGMWLSKFSERDGASLLVLMALFPGVVSKSTISCKNVFLGSKLSGHAMLSGSVQYPRVIGQ